MMGQNQFFFNTLFRIPQSKSLLNFDRLTLDCSVCSLSFSRLEIINFYCILLITEITTAALDMIETTGAISLNIPSLILGTGSTYI